MSPPPLHLIYLLQETKAKKLVLILTLRLIAGLSVLSPPPLRLNQLLQETKATEPVLILTAAGTDPSQELRQLALSSHKHYLEVGSCKISPITHF